MGEDPNEIVTYKKSKAAIQKVVTDVLPPLVAIWEEQLEKFETLFTARDVTVSFAQTAIADKTLPSLVRKFQEYLKINWSQLKNFEGIIISAYLTGLRNKDNLTQFLGGQITISFYENTYILSYNSSDKMINKLYHQVLTEEEISVVTDSIGNWFYERLEETMNQN